MFTAVEYIYYPMVLYLFAFIAFLCLQQLIGMQVKPLYFLARNVFDEGAIPRF